MGSAYPGKLSVAVVAVAARWLSLKQGTLLECRCECLELGSLDRELAWVPETDPQGLAGVAVGRIGLRVSYSTNSYRDYRGL